MRLSFALTCGPSRIAAIALILFLSAASRTVVAAFAFVPGRPATTAAGVGYGPTVEGCAQSQRRPHLCPAARTRRRTLAAAAVDTAHDDQTDLTDLTSADGSGVSGVSNKDGQRVSKRARFLNMLGIKKLRKKHRKEAVVPKEEDGTLEPESLGLETVEVRALDELEDYFADVQRRFRKKKKKERGDSSRGGSEDGVDAYDVDGDYEGDDDIDHDTLLATLKVVGDTQIIGSPDHPDKVHPVLRVLHERRRTGSPLTEAGKSRPDGFKVALIVEGGGMRGCVSAGMVAAIYYLGLEDAIDVVYGSSAGTVIGAYFITRQLPWFGPEIYYDSLTTAGKQFIDTKRLLRSVGLGLLDPRLLKDVVVRRPNGKPVLNLPFLLKRTAQERKPLDWERFEEMQKVQPLKIVASGLKRESSVVLDMEGGNFKNVRELADCMHSSCLLPGIAGPLMNLDTRSKKLTLGNKLEEPHLEPLADSLVFEPLPYKTAIADGATHVIILRTRPDGTDVTGKSSIFERLIMRRFFLRKNKLPNIYTYMRRHLHKKLYGRNIIELNKAAKDFRDYTDTSAPHLMPIAVAPGSPEVTRLETGREAIFEGVRRGFARAYDALVEDPSERGRGAIVAKEYFPDEILDYDPLEIDSYSEAAFDVYLRQLEEARGAHNLHDSLGKTAQEAGAPR